MPDEPLALPTVSEAKGLARLHRKLRNIRFVGLSGSVDDDGIQIGPPLPQRAVATESPSEPTRTLRITGYYGSTSTGGARYMAKLVQGVPDGTFAVDDNMSLPDTGETIGTDTVCYESDPENGIAASHILPLLSFVQGTPDGMGLDGDGNPIRIYRGDGLPLGLFPCKVKKDSGVAGTMVGAVNCDFTYALFYADDNGMGNRPINGGTGITPDVPRFPGCKYNQPADYSPGLAYYVNGQIYLYSVAQEIPATAIVTNITDIQVVDASQEIQVKTQSQLVLDSDTKSGWTTIYTGGEC